MDNLIGKTLGQYQIREVAGKGGMATVYKAFQPSLSRYVALKVLPDYLAQDESFVARFRQEALAAAALRHPNILVVYDVAQEGSTHYMAMEYLEGSTLAQVLSQHNGPLPLPRTVNILSQLASALDFAHRRGLIHRDIKPSNAFIGPDDHVTLMDFGIVKALSSGSQMTRTGTMVGTPDYMSPEQAQGQNIDRRSDIYSLGVVLYQLLTGRVPFEADTPTAILLAHITQTPRPPREINPAIPPAVEMVVMRALEKRPEGRFATAGEMAQALAQAAAGAPAYLPPTVVPAFRTTPTPPPSYPSTTPPPSYPPSTPPPSYQSYTPPPSPPPAPQKRSGGFNWVLWGGIGLAAGVFICVIGFVFLYVIGSSGSATPTPTSQGVAAVTPNSPTEAKTPTSKPGATPSPEPTSSAGVVFYDDFSSVDTSKEHGWSADSGTNVDYTLEENQHTLSIKEKEWIGLDWPTGSYEDFGVETEARALTNDYTEYGIAFRITGEEGKRNYYIFGISTDGNYFLWKQLEGNWANPDPVKKTASPLIKQGQATNTLRVLARGSELVLYINGHQVKSVTDEALSTGETGVFAGSGSSAGAKAAFSRFAVLSAEQAAHDWGVQ